MLFSYFCEAKFLCSSRRGVRNFLGGQKNHIARYLEACKIAGTQFDKFFRRWTIIAGRDDTDAADLAHFCIGDADHEGLPNEWVFGQ